jgi:hypothetical protein
MPLFRDILKFLGLPAGASPPQAPRQAPPNAPPVQPGQPARPQSASAPQPPGSAPARGADVTQIVQVGVIDAAIGTTVQVQANAETLSVRVPPRVANGTRLRLVGKGAPGPAGPGDLYLQIQLVAKAPPQTSAPAAPTMRTAPPPRKPQDRALNLDASMFAPLAGSQIKAELRGKGSDSWSIFRGMAGTDNTWWGNRSVIPPSSDPRTNFIDRGMVGQGLVTAEELVELHQTGDEMLRLRPHLDQAAAIADQAVQQSKQEKEARKQQKKAEAAERKKQYAAAVAQRKATDIIFLGRGVSKGLADRRANPEKLSAAQLPLLATPQDVATALGLTIPQVRWLAYHAEAATHPHYIRFTVPKKSGGTRELAAPHQKMAAAQDWILDNILAKVPAHAAAHGFVPTRSTRTNALPHVQPFVLVNCDLKDFFPTITAHRVIGLFAEMGYSPAVATILALLCTESPRRVVEYAGQKFHVATGPRCLPQGASTSPAISNLIARRLDSRLLGLTRKLGFVYTRYADDLSFSAAAPTVPPEDRSHPNQRIGYLLARLRHIAQDEGFVVNEKKTRVQRRNTAQRVTGVVVNSGTPTVPRKMRRRLRAILHQAQKTGLAAQNRRNDPRFENQVRGLIAYAHMINPAQAQPLREALARVPG